jgi:hypothetical protein
LGTVYHMPIVAMFDEHEPMVETLVTQPGVHVAQVIHLEPKVQEVAIQEVAAMESLADVIDFGAERARKVAASDDDSDSGSQAA